MLDSKCRLTGKETMELYVYIVYFSVQYNKEVHF